MVSGTVDANLQPRLDGLLAEPLSCLQVRLAESWTVYAPARRSADFRQGTEVALHAVRVYAQRQNCITHQHPSPLALIPLDHSRRSAAPMSSAIMRRLLFSMKKLGPACR